MWVSLYLLRFNTPPTTISPAKRGSMMFAPSLYFDLTGYPHAALFDEAESVWTALNRLAAYLDEANLGVIRGHVSSQAYLVHPELISIGEGSVVEPGAYIAGPCIIGKGCVVRHGAYVRGQVVTGDQCVIGHTTEMKGAILLNHAHAAHFAYVGDTILGNHVNLGAGAKCANLRLDNQEITILYQGEKVATGRRKFGAVIGDQAQLGCNSVTNPGTLVGRGAAVCPGVNVGGIIPARHYVKMKGRIAIIPTEAVAVG